MTTREKYIEGQANDLVRTGEHFNIQIYDSYGNKTNYLKIDNDQFNKIINLIK